MSFPPYIKAVRHSSASLYDLDLLYRCAWGAAGAGQACTCCACELSGFLCFLSLPCLAAVRSSVRLHLGFVASRPQWDWKAVSQNFGIWHQMKVKAFNVDLEALVWMNCKGFVTFWLPRGFFWYSLFVSAWFWIDEVSWFFCWLRLLL